MTPVTVLYLSIFRVEKERKKAECRGFWQVKSVTGLQTKVGAISAKPGDCHRPLGVLGVLLEVLARMSQAATPP